MINTGFINRYHTLALLLAATAISYLISHDSSNGWIAGIGPLSLAWFKGRLVILDFMELRHVPNIWRWGFEGGISVVTAILIVIYLIIPNAC